jgi:hypothetical protein
MPDMLYYRINSYQLGSGVWQTGVIVSDRPDILNSLSRQYTAKIIHQLNALGVAVAYCGMSIMPEGYYHLRLYFMEGLGKKERPILPLYKAFLGLIQLHQPEQDFIPTYHQPLKQDKLGEFVSSQELLF